ncbi:S-layer homology domain-containing protein [Paenibacillus pabuli]|uniref:S-layer homology domain-containing protein n=1 Tax=Paenibacillus pabuli TaxID=1472 RepID=UPI003CED2192
MKKIMISGVTALALFTGGIVGWGAIGNSVQAAQATLQFKDVPSTHWAAEAINSAVEQGYFKGYADGTFKPSSPVTKAEMASILGRLADQPDATTQEQNNFTDVPDWAKSGVSIAIKKGFISPSKYNGKLDAQAALQRGEMASWLTQGLTAVDPEYTQALSDVTNTVVPAKEYFTGKLASSQKNAVAVALGTGLMSVANDKTFGTDRTTTRAEVAVLIARYASVAKTKPADFQGLNELREVGLTGTNLSVIAPKYKKAGQEKFSESYDYSKVTGDFAKVRNQELVTKTNYADIKVKNWIVVNPYVEGDARSIYFPTFVDEKNKPLRGAYYSFAEFEMNIKNSMNQLQGGSLIQAVAMNPVISPSSKAVSDYSVPHINDLLGAKGVFIVKNPVYWGKGLLHFDNELNPEVFLTLKDGTIYRVRPN